MKFTNIIIIVLIAVVFLQRFGCKDGGNTVPRIDTVKTTDTAWIKKDTVITKTMRVNHTIHDTVPSEWYMNIADTGYAYRELLKQYQTMAFDYLATNTYIDTIYLDSFGTVQVYDSVKYNRLQNRSVSSSYKIPVITNTVTITKEAPAKRQLYIGGSIQGDKHQFQSVNSGLLYKTKKDHVYQIYVGIGPSLKPSVGVGMYWKLH